MKLIKNKKKRIDPRYFLSETTHRDLDENQDPKSLTRQALELLENGVLFVSNIAAYKNSDDVGRIQGEIDALQKLNPQQAIEQATEFLKSAVPVAQSSANQPLQIALNALQKEVQESQAVYARLQQMEINDENSRTNALEAAYNLAVRQEKRYKNVQDRATRLRKNI